MDAFTDSLRSIEVVALARRVVEALSASAWQRGKVTVRLEADQAEVWVMADEGRLEQALAGLVHDAVRHTLPGGVVLVWVSSQPEGVAIQVRDSGEGIWFTIVLGKDRPQGFEGNP